MADNDVLIQIRADVADINAKLADVKGHIGKVTDETRKMSDQSKGVLETAKKYWLEFAAGIYAAYQTMRRGWDLAETAANFEQQKMMLNRFAAYYGTTADAIIDNIKKATSGTVSYIDAVSTAANGMMKRLTPDQIIKLAEASEFLADVSGKKTAEVFQNLTESIAIGRDRAIKAAVGIIDLQTKYTDKQIAGMSNIELAQAKYAMAMEYVRNLQSKIGDAGETSAKKMERFRATVHDLSLEMGQVLIRAFAGAMSVLYAFLETTSLINAGLLAAWKITKQINLDAGTPEGGMNYPLGSKEREESQREIDEVQKSIDDFLSKKDKYAKKSQEMWGVSTAPTGQLAKALDPKLFSDNTKKISNELAVFEDKLRTDVAKQGMEEFQQKLMEIAHQAKDYRNQWGNKEIINWWKNNKIAFEEAKHAIDEQIKNWNLEAQTVERAAKTRLEYEKSMYAERAKQGEYSPLEQMNAELDFEKKALQIEKARLAVQLLSAGIKFPSAEKDREILDVTAKIADTEQKILDIEEKRAIKGWGLSDLGASISALKNFAQQAADTGKQLGEVFTNAFKNMTDALTDFVMTGELNFSAFARSVIRDLVRIQIQASITGPLSGMLGGWLAGLFGTAETGVAKGDVFERGRVMRFGFGTVIHRPTLFPMAGGMGLMGEEGPEAVMPLTRLSGGYLGVKTSGGGGDNYNISIYAVDSKSFADICERNPAAFITPITKAMKYGQLKDWREMLATKR